MYLIKLFIRWYTRTEFIKFAYRNIIIIVTVIIDLITIIITIIIIIIVAVIVIIMLVIILTKGHDVSTSTYCPYQIRTLNC